MSRQCQHGNRARSPVSDAPFRTLADSYGWRAIVRVPFRSGPSHESAPEYEAVSALCVILDAVPVTVAEHMGVTSTGFPLGFPAGKSIVNVSIVPAIVPESVPVLFR
jgi:hypothetical protein